MYRTLLIAGFAGWLTSAVYVAATETHFFSPEESAFLTATAVTSNYELQAAQIAQRLSSNADVQTETQLAVADQLRFAREMKEAVIGRDPAFRWPAGIDGPRERMLNKLRVGTIEGEYRRQMISSHLLTQVRNREYLNRKSMDRRIRSIITRSMPRVETELRTAMR